MAGHCRSVAETAWGPLTLLEPPLMCPQGDLSLREPSPCQFPKNPERLNPRMQREPWPESGKDQRMCSNKHNACFQGCVTVQASTTLCPVPPSSLGIPSKWLHLSKALSSHLGNQEHIIVAYRDGPHEG